MVGFRGLGCCGFIGKEGEDFGATMGLDGRQKWKLETSGVGEGGKGNGFYSKIEFKGDMWSWRE